MSNSNLIRDMIPVLSKLGWIKHHRKTDKGVCLIGAWDEVYPNDDYRIAPIEWDAIENTIKEQFPDRVLTNSYKSIMPHFNDHEKTVVEDVIMVLEKAAIKWDERI